IVGLDKFPGNVAMLGNERFIAVLGSDISSLPVSLKAGQYILEISSRGFASQNIYPHLNIYVGDRLIGNYFVTPDLQQKQFDLDIRKDADVILKIEMDNDHADSTGDRNAFISKIIISKK
ncbi:MAG TPA: carbohydrate-binding domain-containing protein, partial [Puia sp.]|nr:carbohydrate-binding domain-containing protein [Puia sp.]